MGRETGITRVAYLPCILILEALPPWCLIPIDIITAIAGVGVGIFVRERGAPVGVVRVFCGPRFGGC